ncbi:MAG: hypothetical protein ACTSQE_17050 [Candidatus Heimdallarchaeaceae archaeon]
MKTTIRFECYKKESHENGICPIVNKKAINVYTDHSKKHIDNEGEEFLIPFNSCGLCGENKTTSQRLTELQNRRMKEQQQRLRRND